MGNVFGKAFRFSALVERKVVGKWNKIFMGIFVSTSLCFGLFLRCPLLNRAHSGIV